MLKLVIKSDMCFYQISDRVNVYYYTNVDVQWRRQLTKWSVLRLSHVIGTCKKLAPFDSFINHTKDTPDYQLNTNCLNIPSLLISQHSNHFSLCKLGLIQNDWVRKVSRTVVKLSYENHVKSPRRHLLRYKENWNLLNKKKFIFISFLNIFQYSSVLGIRRFQWVM
jgi:hypothetical protein